MKYIRTKENEIVDVMSFTGMNKKYALEHREAFEKECKTFNWYNNSMKQADAIEELCDEFVVIHKELNGSRTVHRYNWLGKSEHETGNEVYGAIWTKWGLRFVAKMNDKGELELL